MVHVSTDYVFDGLKEPPLAYSESDPVSPLSVYGKTKLEGENRVLEELPGSIVVRTAWLYGIAGSNFLKTMLRLAMSRPGSPITVVNDQFGSPTYVPHLATAIVQLIATGAFGTYHLAGHGGTSWFQLTRTVFAQLGIAVPVEPLATSEMPRSAQRPRYSVLTSIQDPRITLPAWEDGVAAFVQARSGDS